MIATRDLIYCSGLGRMKQSSISEPFNECAMLTRIQDDMKRLSCAKHNFTDSDVIPLGIELGVNRSLLRLNLEDNDIGEEGFLSLAKGLLANKTLRTLNLSNNIKITSEVVNQILIEFLENSSLQECLLEGTNVSLDIQNQINKRLQLNTFPVQLKRCILELEGNSGSLVDSINLTYDYMDPEVCKLSSVERLASAITGNGLRCSQIQSFSATRLFKGLNVASIVSKLCTPSLTSIAFIETGLEEIDIQEVFSPLVRSAPSLKTVVLSNNSFSDGGAEILFAALEESSTVTQLDVSSCSVSPSWNCRLRAALSLNCQPVTFKQSLPRILSNDPTLTSLSFQGRDGAGREPGRGYFNNMAAIIVAEALQRNSNVKLLDFSNNHIGPEGCIPLAELIESTTSLTAINLSKNKIGDDGAKRLLQGLEKTDVVQHIILTDCGISTKLVDQVETESLLNRLPLVLKRIIPKLDISSPKTYDRTLVQLDFSISDRSKETTIGRTLGHDGAAILCNVLQHNEHITSVNISANALRDKGACCVAKYMTENSIIRSINLSHNHIAEEGGMALLRALRFNNSVTTLEVAGNKSIPYNLRDDLDVAVDLNLLEPSVKEIITRLSNSDKGLLVANLSKLSDHHRITDKLAGTLSDVLIGNCRLQELNLDGNLITHVGVTHLCQWLQTAEECLHTLSIRNNDLNAESAIELQKALLAPTAPPLTTLLLSGNHLHEAGGLAIVEILREKQSLTKVDVSDNRISISTSQLILNISCLNCYSSSIKSDVLGLLDNNPSITEVDLSGHTDQQLQTAAVSGISKSGYVKTALFRSCSLGKKVMIEIAKGISGHKSLNTLDISLNTDLLDNDIDTLSNIIESSGCNIRQVLSEGINVSEKCNKRLGHSTQFASLPMLAVQQLLGARESNINTEGIIVPYLEHCEGNTVCDLLRYCLSGNQFVTDIDLSGLHVSDSGVTKVADIIRESRILKSIKLNDNPITVAGLQEVVKSVWESASITTVELQNITAFSDSLDESDDDMLLAIALKGRLQQKLDENTKLTVTTTTKKQTRQQREPHDQLNPYRTKQYVEEIQNQIMRDSLLGYIRKRRSESSPMLETQDTNYSLNL